MIPPLVVLDDIYERWCQLLKEPGPHQSDLLTDLIELKTELKELITTHPEVTTYPKNYIISSTTPEQALIKSRAR